MRTRLRRSGALIGACAIVLSIATIAHAALFDFEQITVDATAGGKALTAAKVPAFGFIYVQCRIRTAEISFLTVGPTVTTVTASVGQLAEPGDLILITSREEALNLRMIRTGAVSGQADCSYKTQP